MKLEIGMYVRTKDGHIDKIKNIAEEYYCIGEDEEDKLYKIYQLSNIYYDDEFNEDNDWVFEKFIIKASYNIIDILEVGDCVNRNKIGYMDDCKGAMKQFYYDYENPNEDVGHWEEEIKTVVTKEQFESIEYRIGE